MPNDDVGQEAFAVIRDAMKGKGMVALGRIVLHKREHVMALEPFGKGLLGTTLHYAYEVRKAEDYFSGISDIKVPGEMLKLAEHILDTKKGDFDPASSRITSRTRWSNCCARSRQASSRRRATNRPSPPRNVINLMDALRAQRPGREGRAGREATRMREIGTGKSKKGGKRAAGQTEMLLPIRARAQACGAAAAKPRPTAKKPAARRKAG